MLTQYNKDTNALIRRKIRPAGGAAQRGGEDGGVLQIRIPPPPIPLSWGRNVEPFDASVSLSSRVSATSLGEGARATHGAASRTSVFGLYLLARKASLQAPPPSQLAAGGSAVPTPAPVPAPAPAPASSSGPSCYYETPDLPAFKFDSGPSRRIAYQAVLINSGWEVGTPEGSWLER